VRLIDENGENIGVVSITEARSAAENAGLDLVEIAPNADPPVCKILDLGKYIFEQNKNKKISDKDRTERDSPAPKNQRAPSWI